MRILLGFIAFMIWAALLAFMLESGVEISDEVQLISLAVVAAGAMAGGD